jgi:hypothetical protein
MSVLMNGQIENACRALAVVLGLAISAGSPLAQPRSTRPEAAWSWCRDRRESKTLALRILLDGKSIYRSSFHVCRVRSGDVPRLKERPEIAFSFRGGPVFQGEHPTSPKEMVEVSIWQAGSEPDGLLLGISFSTNGRVLLNTLHLVEADRASESQLDRGLLVRTYPVPRPPP